jgi:hypothetical protein
MPLSLGFILDSNFAYESANVVVAKTPLYAEGLTGTAVLQIAGTETQQKLGVYAKYNHKLSQTSALTQSTSIAINRADNTKFFTHSDRDGTQHSLKLASQKLNNSGNMMATYIGEGTWWGFPATKQLKIRVELERKSNGDVVEMRRYLRSTNAKPWKLYLKSTFNKTTIRH